VHARRRPLMVHRGFLLASVLALMLAGCGRATSTPELIHVRLPMGYIPNVQFAPFYVAVERGYFRDEGIEIEFDYSYETDGVALVGANELKFSLASGEQVLLAREQGLPIVYVMGWWQDFPVAVAAPADHGIARPEDLVGKRIGIPILGGASYIGFRALMDAVGISEDSLELDSIGFNQVEALLTGQVDAAVVYAVNEPFQLEAEGMPVNLFAVKDYVSLASNGIITNEKTISEHPELVRGMVRAAIRGVRDVIQEPDAAYQICTQYVEALGEADESVQRQVLAASIEYWKADQLGHIEEGAWRNMQRVLLNMGLIETPMDVRAAFSNDFLP
jgi:NitT/TauT family transport system substrate-binding protein